MAIDIANAPLDGKVALVVGSEGHGLTHRWMTEADHRVTIPMSREIDSLNVAAATAVACYVLGAAPPGDPAHTGSGDPALLDDLRLDQDR